MKHFLSSALSVIALATLFSLPAKAQGGPSEADKEKAEKQMLEFIDKEVERLSGLLNLEYWQEFYVDSTLNHDLHALQEELASLSQAKVSNTDIYVAVQDKWMQAIYDSYHRFFDEEQWKKYLKTGAAREQKARDKRKARNDVKN